jgi:hypothetical protein
MPMKMEEEKPSKRYTSKIGKEERKEERAKAMKDKYPDPFFERNEFKEGFYDQEKPPVSYETLKGTAAKPIPNVTDTESFKEGGMSRGQKAIQVKKVPFRGVF